MAAAIGMTAHRGGRCGIFELTSPPPTTVIIKSCKTTAHSADTQLEL